MFEFLLIAAASCTIFVQDVDGETIIRVPAEMVAKPSPGAPVFLPFAVRKELEQLGIDPSVLSVLKMQANPGELSTTECYMGGMDPELWNVCQRQLADVTPGCMVCVVKAKPGRKFYKIPPSDITKKRIRKTDDD
jgi:hypothetical protein